MRHPVIALFALVALVSAGARLRADPVWQINIVGDMYSDGRKLEHPTPAKPAFYLPVVAGYAELGGHWDGDAPPPPRQMVHSLALALADQGYLATRQIEVPAPPGTPAGPDGKHPATVKAFQPAPSLIVVLSWGAIHAQAVNLNADVTTDQPPLVANGNQILGLIAGKNFDSVADFGMKTSELIESVGADRFFVMISAYDFAAYTARHKRVLLWVAKMSVPSTGESMQQLMPILIKQGAPMIGRESLGPKEITLPSIKSGHVEIGPAVPVKD